MSLVSFFKKAKQLSENLNSWDRKSKVMIIGHRDGDGIAATTVLNQGLKHLGFEKIIPQILLSPDIDLLISMIKNNSPKYVITCDIGAEFAPTLEKRVKDFIITDHHPKKISNYGAKQLNCIEFGLDDEIDASGSTTALSLLTNLFDDTFWDSDKGKVILAFAVAGAISDFQFQKGIHKVNGVILNKAKIHSAVVVSKDISIFGRSMYPAYIAINRASIPGLTDYYFCRDIINASIDPRIGSYWKRIIDLDQEEKKNIIDIIISQLSEFSHKINIKEFLAKEVIGDVFDLIALYGWDCTLIRDGRATFDPREILHQVNYCCRLGHWDIALDLLNHKMVSDHTMKTISEFHRQGDQEVAEALKAYQNNLIELQSDCDGKVLLADFTDLIFYDEVGVIAGVIMKQDRDIDIMLSSCRMENNGLYKVSVRARSNVWEMVDSDNEFADAKKVYEKTKIETGSEIKYGGHRFAMSGYLPKETIPILFKNMVTYYKKLIN